MWGKEGYLTQTEGAVPREETAARVEVPSSLLGLPALQDRGGSSQTPGATTATPTATPEADREKQQLASSLFVGLGSQSSAGPSLVRASRPMLLLPF